MQCIFQRCQNFTGHAKPAIACAQIKPRLGLSVKIRTTAWQQAVLLRQLLHLPCLRRRVGAVIALHPHKPRVLQPAHQLLKLPASQLVQSRMGKNRNAPCSECHVDHFFRGDFLPVHKIRRVVAQIPVKRLIDRKSVV